MRILCYRRSAVFLLRRLFSLALLTRWAAFWVCITRTNKCTPQNNIKSLHFLTPHICITYKSTMSEQSSLATSTNEEKSVPISVEVVRKYNTEQLIQFLHEKEDLQLNDTHFEILRNEEITGPAFLSTTEQMLRSYGMKGGPALVLAEFAQKIKQTTVTFSRQVSNVRDMLSNMRTEG
ncbi:hypothetical protein C2G38_209394 [Gigaspora rosea]|uniref:SAM domain-containing protein n=1 Tax=Gigaspora rosea TaxID=44941 RepID=A0A397USL8_9GLOM|nr:hypothetical protein C2G38_209394 [Gigaspora rosea]